MITKGKASTGLDRADFDQLGIIWVFGGLLGLYLVLKGFAGAATFTQAPYFASFDRHIFWSQVLLGFLPGFRVLPGKFRVLVVQYSRRFH